MVRHYYKILCIIHIDMKKTTYTIKKLDNTKYYKIVLHLELILELVEIFYPRKLILINDVVLKPHYS